MEITSKSYLSAFVPTVNGERPVDFEIMSGQDVQMDNDLLEYLKKSIMSGMGIPSSYINNSDEVEFSRTISMQNVKFLRNVVIKQKKLNKAFTTLYRTLYRNEFENELNSDKNNIDVSKISVSFPSPATLNMTNLADQINTVSNIVDYITDVMAGETIQGEERDGIKRMLAQKYLPMIDWEDINETINKSKIHSVEESLLKNKNGEDEGMDNPF